MSTISAALAQGIEHHKRGDLARAEAIYRQILAREPAHAAASHMLGLLALQSSRLDEALALLEQSIAIDPSGAEYLNNTGSVYRATGRPADALPLFERALQLEPRNTGSLYNRALALSDLGRLDEAVADYHRCLELDANHVGALNNLGDLERETGQLESAIAHPDGALAIDPYHALAHSNRSLVLLSMGRLVEGFAESEWRLRVGELKPRVFPQPPWDGSPMGDKTLLVYAEQGLGDTLQFAPLAERGGVQLLSLQKVPGVEQISALRGTFGVVDLGSHIDNDTGAFMDTAAIMKNLDLVVTSDTACAHLAGALNVPAWVALRDAPGCRWLRGRADSPWYPSLRLFRQSTPGDWPGVFRAMAAQLRSMLDAR